MLRFSIDELHEFSFMTSFVLTVPEKQKIPHPKGWGMPIRAYDKRSEVRTVYTILKEIILLHAAVISLHDSSLCSYCLVVLELRMLYAISLILV